MPRKTKEQKELENEIKVKKDIKKSSTAKKSVSTPLAINTSKKETTTRKKATTTKKDSEKVTSSAKSKAVTAKKKTSTSTTKRNVTVKDSTPKKTTTKKSTSTKKKVEIVEYYDLPYRYNQTIVKVLAQTPTNLFIYWDISDNDRKNFEKQYGDNFFETTKPILIVHNNTLGYRFEVEINDFANSWYLHVSDSKCDYKIELGRKPIVKTEKLNTDYIYVTTSNQIESPNDRILFDRNQKMVYFKNIKTGEQTERKLTSISFIRNMGKIYTIYDLYKSIYQDENIEEMFDLSNPSSGNPSSNSFSSKFK